MEGWLAVTATYKPIVQRVHVCTQRRRGRAALDAVDAEVAGHAKDRHEDTEGISRPSCRSCAHLQAINIKSRYLIIS